MVKDDILYSTAWAAVKIIANITVYAIAYKVPFLIPLIRLWCAYVTVKPEDNNNIVLNKGNSKASIDSIPAGGQWAPISIVGDNELWKYAQNIPKKNRASDIINNPTPMFKPLCTAIVWLPK